MIESWGYLKEFEKEKKEILGAVERVFESGRLILGEEGEKFEREFSNFCGCKFGVAVNSGTDALFISLKALGVGEDDEVITVPNTAMATVSAIVQSGARPVFVDVREDTLLLDTTKIEEKITKKTKVILPVHLYGQMVNMEEVLKIARRYNLFVLEDCAQSAGACWAGKKAGSFGDAGAFSFYPTKILGGYGDGGMVVTNNKSLAKFAKEFRQYGHNGINSRLDEVQAAILRFKLKNIEKYIKKRREIADRYDEGLKGSGLTLPFVDRRADMAWYLYVVRHKRREEIIKYLKSRDIFVNISYEKPLKSGFPVSDKACREVFSLPLYPELGERKQEMVIKLIREFFKK